tara:strand:+ start:312 stop:884 length:573 start_codon:yes stop_codon:yes gene_type:complete
MKLPGIFNNKILCYAMLFLAVMNVVGYLSTSAYECLVVFGLAYYFGHCYLKNQTAAILVGLFASNFIFGCGRVKESFVEGADDKLSSTLEKVSEKAAKAAGKAMEKAKEGMKKAELTKEQCTTGGGKWDEANKKCKQAFESFKEAADAAAATADAAADAASAAAAAEDEDEDADTATSEAAATEGFRNYW